MSDQRFNTCNGLLLDPVFAVVLSLVHSDSVVGNRRRSQDPADTLESTGPAGKRNCGEGARFPRLRPVGDAVLPRKDFVATLKNENRVYAVAAAQIGVIGSHPSPRLD